MEKQKRYSLEFRERAVRRMKLGDNVSQLPRELGVDQWLELDFFESALRRIGGRERMRAQGGLSIQRTCELAGVSRASFYRNWEEREPTEAVWMPARMSFPRHREIYSEGVTYYNSGTAEPIGALLTTTLGSGDTQNFTYDLNTGRMTSYSASVGTTPVVISGTLAWNRNGTLQTNNIVDGYNSSDTQLCTYVYDDFVRVSSVTCKNGATPVWNQAYDYGTDAFGNVKKTTTQPGLNWNPGYNPANNHYTLSGVTYDANGNLTADSFHTYTWLADGHVATIDSATITYDALGNKVEVSVGGVIHEYVSAFGITAQMTGQTQNSATVPLPGGVQALYAGSALRSFRYPDWQGTIRAEATRNTLGSWDFTESLAFDPFGNRYAVKGAPFNVDTFTGKPDQIVTDEYDFPARQEHNGQGRWISPDPTRGTGNKYVYAGNNPLSVVDPYGLEAVVINGIEYGGSEAELEGSKFLNPFEDSESHESTSTQTSAQSSAGDQPQGQTDPPPTTGNQQVAEEKKAEQQGQNQKSCGFFCRLGQRLKNGFTGHGFKTNQQLLPKGTVTTSESYRLKPNFYAASVTVGVASQSLTYVPSTNDLYYAPGPGVGTGAALTAGNASDPNGFASGPSASGCYFAGAGGCAGVSASGDTAIQVGVGVGGWGASSGYGIDPVSTFLNEAYENLPAGNAAPAIPAGGLNWEDPYMGFPY